MPSIYKRICAEFHKTGRLPYEFMPSGIGSTSIAALRGNELPRNLREVCARKTWAAIFSGGQWSMIEPIWYAQEFRQEALRRIEAGEIARDEAARQGMLLCRDSELTQAVEAGMILMGLRRDDLTERIMERLALHSKFTQIAAIACADWPEPNARIFRWLQNTRDCGSVICAMMLHPQDDQQRGWLFNRGLETGRPQAEMARSILARPSMENFILRCPDDARTFHSLCRLVCYAPDMPEAQVRAFALKLLQGMQFADSYIDLCAMHRMQRVLLPQGDDLYAEWTDRCDPLRRQLRLRGVIEREMDDPQEDSALLAMVLNGEQMTPPLERLMRTLASQELPEPMLRYLLVQHDQLYAEPLLRCMLRVSPKAVLDDPPSVRDAREYPDGKYDIWLARALGALCGDPALDAETVLKCLSGRLALLRYQAVRCLAEMEDGALSREAEHALHRAIAQEPDMELRKRMQHLLNGMNPPERSRCRMPVAAIDPDALQHCGMGERLAYVEITGREKYNADGVSHLLREGDRLLLTAAPEEDSVRAVTTAGLVVGDVELEDYQADILRWLQEGRTLIAVLENGAHMERMWADIRAPLRTLALPSPDNLRRFPRK